MRRIALVLVTVLSIGTGSAAALAGPDADVSASLTGAGGGLLIANPNPAGQTWTWQICDRAGEACAPFGSGASIETGTPAAGTTFRATANTGAAGLSPIWNGPLRVATPPSATGIVAANRLVTPVSAVWEGGWSGDFTQTMLSLCPSTAGVGCLAPVLGYEGSCPTGSLTLDPDFVGWWLRVSTTVFGHDTAFALPALVSASGYTEADSRSTPQTSSAFAARIGPASSPRAKSCGPSPLVPGLPPSIALKVQAATIDGDGTAVVSCTCTIDLHASGRRGNAAVDRHVKGDVLARVGPRRLARLGRGPIHYTLFIDGHRVARRTIGRRAR